MCGADVQGAEVRPRPGVPQDRVPKRQEGQLALDKRRDPGGLGGV